MNQYGEQIGDFVRDDRLPLLSQFPCDINDKIAPNSAGLVPVWESVPENSLGAEVLSAPLVQGIPPILPPPESALPKQEGGGRRGVNVLFLFFFFLFEASPNVVFRRHVLPSILDSRHAGPLRPERIISPSPWLDRTGRSARCQPAARLRGNAAPKVYSF